VSFSIESEDPRDSISLTRSSISEEGTKEVIILCQRSTETCDPSTLRYVAGVHVRVQGRCCLGFRASRGVLEGLSWNNHWVMTPFNSSNYCSHLTC
jgi:hypothetical protein